MSESKQTESETSMSSNNHWSWPSRAELPAADVQGPPKPLNVPDTHVPELRDIYEYNGHHWKVYRRVGTFVDVARMDSGPNPCALSDVPIGYVQRYMRRIWPED
jgi:hypothetical protein